MYTSENIIEENNEDTYIEAKEWKMTMYGSDEGNNMMSFVLKSDIGGLVIIDGGYDDFEPDLNVLRQEIEANNNVVDHWIITHFDADHAGAFLKITEENPNIEIKNIYVQEIPERDILIEKNVEERSLGILDTYLSRTYQNVNIVHSGDEFDVLGLKMKVLSSYDKWMAEKSSNLLNNGSMMFTLSGNETKALFCSDVQNIEIYNYILENYKDDLDCDILQVGHHGNTKFPKEFFEIVSPKEALFCAPKWLYYNERNVSWFTIENVKKYCEEVGANLWHYDSTPLELVIK